MAELDKIAATFGPYRLLHQLGVGGMGQVFLASQASEHGIQRLVAVKRILGHLASDKKLVQLFLDEVRIAAQLNHGNIVQVVDHGCIDGRYYMAMEYVHGENLADVLERLDERAQRFPLDLLLHVASSVCEGLDHAHRKAGMDGRALEIVHRDISPHNVLLSFQGEVKIADFGVARAAEQTHQTLGGELRGKLNYMSPEQAFGHPIDRRSDLFSLGMVLYEALAGENPVARDGPLATLEAVRAVDIAPLRSRRAELPEELYELVDGLLAPEPEQRPDSARALHEGLQRIMRMHSMVVTAFDLADYLGDLFPESGGERSSGGEWQDRTAEGRRADAAVATRSGPNEDLVRRTLFYQRKRRPDGGSLLLSRDERGRRYEGATEPGGGPSPRSRAPSWLVALLAALVAGGGVAALAYYRAGNDRVGNDRAGNDRAGNDAGPRPSPNGAIGASADSAAYLARSTAPRLDGGVRDHAARQARRAAGPAQLRARLRIQSQPSGARVLIDGVPRGRTPLSLLLRTGPHRLRALLPGHEGEPRTVLLRAGEAQRVTLALRAQPARLQLSSSHGCALQIGRRPQGRLTTAVTTRPQAPGLVQLSCTHGGAAARKTVRLAPGQGQRVHFAFGVLSVNLQPWAKVTVDGQPRGDTPLRLVLAAGTHQVRLDNAPAKRRSDRTVEVREGQTTRLSSW